MSSQRYTPEFKDERTHPGSHIRGQVSHCYKSPLEPMLQCET